VDDKTLKVGGVSDVVIMRRNGLRAIISLMCYFFQR